MDHEVIYIREIRNWWLPLIFGVLLVLMSIWIFSNPVESFKGLNFLFSIGILFSAAITIGFALSNKNTYYGWGWLLTGGILEALFGLILMLQPHVTMSILAIIIGIWLIVKGISQLSWAIELRRYGYERWFWTLTGGILIVLASFFIIIHPAIIGLTIAFWIGFAFMVAGIIYIFHALRLKRTL